MQMQHVWFMSVMKVREILMIFLFVLTIEGLVSWYSAITMPGFDAFAQGVIDRPSVGSGQNEWR